MGTLRIFPRDPAITTDQLELWIDPGDVSCYSGSGTSYTDLSTNAYTGTIAGSPTFTSATRSFNLNGSTQHHYISDGMYDAGELLESGTGDITISVWCRPETFPSDDTNHNVSSCLFGHANATGNDVLEVGINTSGNLEFYIDDLTAGNYEVEDTGTLLTANNWYNVVFIYSITDNEVQLIVNNGSPSISSTTLTGFDNPAANTVSFGSSRVGTWARFDGDLGPIMAWNKILDAGELTDQFEYYKGYYGL